MQQDFYIMTAVFNFNNQESKFMGWLQRLFGKDEAEKAKKVSSTPKAAKATTTNTTTSTVIPPERVGLDGTYDESGLAKRVALAFDRDNALDDIETLWVAQSGSTVVLKGTVPSQQVLDRMAKVAREVEGATSVDLSQAKIA
jgi:osmotically-inducible protein OsmY